MEWLNEPPSWHAQGDTLTVTAGPKTDFWRKTHYGFISSPRLEQGFHAC